MEHPNLPVRNLLQNSLVSGIDSMLEDIRDEYGRFDVTFSDEEVDLECLKKTRMTWVRGDRFDSAKGGNWYRNEDGKEGWLCSVLFDYFNPCPLELHIYTLAPKGKGPRVTLKQRIGEILTFAKRGRFGELIPLDEEEERG